MSLGASLVDDGGFLLLRAERRDQLAAQIFFMRQDAQAFTRALAHFGWIGAEETGRALHLAVHDRKVLRDVVAFHAVTPRSGLRRLAEYREEITIGIAPWAGPVSIAFRISSKLMMLTALM